MLQYRKNLRNEINLRVDDTLLEWLNTRAEQAKLPTSTYVRQVLTEAASLDLQRRNGQPDEAA
jgi:predicted HicB family RNase H-like nuclease